MKDNKLGLGVVGASANYGWGMRAHMPAFLSLPEYDLVAVCTTSQETAEPSALNLPTRGPNFIKTPSAKNPATA